MPTGGRKNRHILVVEIETLDRQGQRQAKRRLHSWLETFGYTASGHGFEFRAVGVLTGENIKNSKKRA